MVARSPLSNAASQDWSCLAAGVLGNVKWASPAAVWARSGRAATARAVNVVIPVAKANEKSCFNAFECVAKSRLIYRSLRLDVFDDSNALRLVLRTTGELVRCPGAHALTAAYASPKNAVPPLVSRP